MNVPILRKGFDASVNDFKLLVRNIYRGWVLDHVVPSFNKLSTHIFASLKEVICVRNKFKHVQYNNVSRLIQRVIGLATLDHFLLAGAPYLIKKEIEVVSY